MVPEITTYGIMAEFSKPERFLAAIRRTRAAGYKRMDAYSPNPVDGLAEAMQLRDSPAPTIVLAGGLFGAIAGFFIQYYASAIDYPFNVGGRPLLSWVAFIPVTFEMAVLCAVGFALVFGIIAANGLPCPYHPVFNVPQFGRATRDRYFVCIEAKDPMFDKDATRRFLESLDPLDVYDVRD